MLSSWRERALIDVFISKMPTYFSTLRSGVDVKLRDAVIVGPVDEALRLIDVLPDVDIVGKKPLPYSSSIGLAITAL